MEANLANLAFQPASMEANLAFQPASAETTCELSLFG